MVVIYLALAAAISVPVALAGWYFAGLFRDDGFSALIAFWAFSSVGLAFLPGAKPGGSHSVLVLGFLTMIYACWPVLNIRNFGATMYWETFFLLFPMVVLSVGGLIMRAVASLFLGSRAAISFLALIAVVGLSLHFETYVRSGAIGWIVMNWTGFAPIAAEVQKGRDVCWDGKRPACDATEDGLVVFYRSPLNHNGRAWERCTVLHMTRRGGSRRRPITEAALRKRNVQG